MIITKTPFRISFAGGGSDIRDYYNNDFGCVVSATINKYMYIVIHPFFEKEHFLLKYSKTEYAKKYDEIHHPIFREALKQSQIKGVEIASFADIPAGTGLGSSSSFSVGLINAIHAFKNKKISKLDLAKMACELEIDILKEPIGKQDQYAAAYGGLNFFKFNKDESVETTKLNMPDELSRELESNLVMFYTGITRSASLILDEQKKKISSNITEINALKKMAIDTKNALEKGNLNEFGKLLNEGWLIKQRLANNITNPNIDALYNKAIKSGAIGGKLLGAGGGGFLLFYCKKELHHVLEKELDLFKLDFKFDSLGSHVINLND